MFQPLRPSPHFLGRRQAEDIKYHSNSMQPVVPKCGLANIGAPNRSQPLRVSFQVREYKVNVGRIEWHVNYRIRPIELLFEFLRARRLADHPRARRGTLVEPCTDLV